MEHSKKYLNLTLVLAAAAIFRLFLLLFLVLCLFLTQFLGHLFKSSQEWTIFTRAFRNEIFDRLGRA